jgi:glycosyltransferase involved in cell wall biosynthesis
VVHVVRALEIGGLERIVCELALGSRSVASEVVCLMHAGVLGESLAAQGIPVHVVGMHGSKLRALARLCACLRARRPAILHCHNLYAHLYGALAGRICGVPHVMLTRHGTFVPQPRLSWSLSRWLLKRTHIVAVSEDIQRIMKPFSGRRGSLCHIANGISLEPFSRLPSRREARQALDWSESGPVIGTVARLSEGKGHEDLLHAFELIGKACPGARLVIVGDGPTRALVEKQIADRGLRGTVEMLGERRDVPAILAALDLFALASCDEGLPVTILEAMAAGLPVVTTNVGGIPQAVVEGETGLLVPPRSPAALAEAAVRVLKDTDLARRLGLAGRKRILEQFDSRLMVSRYESLYLELLGARKPASNW